MSAEGWEQRLENLARAQERADGLSVAVFNVVRGYVYPDVADAITDALIAGPLAPLLEAQAAVERVRELLPRLDHEKTISSFPLRFGYEDSANKLRRALDGGAR